MQPKLYSPYKRWKAVSITPKMLMAYPGLSLASKAVWGMLASHAGEQEFAYPSQATLARECSLSRRCVQRALDELEQKQFIACLGLHRRNKVWGFLEHPVLADSASNVRTSTNGSASDLRTTEENEPKSHFDEPKCAKMTQDSASNVRKIVRQNDASYMKGFMEEVHGKGSSSTIGTTVIGTLDPPQNARAPDDDMVADPRESKVPLLVLFGNLTGRCPSPNDQKINRDIMTHPDWDMNIALKAMQLCHEQAGGTQISSLKYYARAIIQALETGRMPGQKGGNNVGDLWD